MQSCPHLKRWLAAGLTGAVFVLIAFLALSGPSKQAVTADEVKAGGPEWTMYGGTASRNMISPTAKDLPLTWSVEDGELKNVKWFADLGSKAYGGPIIAGGKVYIGTNNQNPRDKKWIDKAGKAIDLGIIMAFGEAKGDFLWQIVFEKLKAGQVQDWPKEGICSTPVVEGDRFYFVSNRCEVVCADTKGEVIWKLDMIAKLGVFPHNIAACSPLGVGDYLWVVTANGVNEDHISVPSPRAPSFIKVAKKDGSVAWLNNWPTIKLTEAAKGDADQESFFKRLVNRGDLIQHGQWSNPSFADIDGQKQVIFPGGEGWIYSFDLDGKLLWKFDCNPKDAEYALQGRGTRNDFISTPVVYDNKIYIGVGQDPEHNPGVGHLWCIDAKKRGDVSPDLVTDATVWPPKTKPNPNSAMVWHYGGFTTPEDFKKLNRKYYFGRTMSTCAIKDNLVYISELAGYLHCLDAKTGQVHWTHDTRAAIWSSPYWADNKVYLGTDKHQVFVFAHGKEKKLLAKNDMDGKVRATPVAIGNVLYVMTENRLYALANKK